MSRFLVHAVALGLGLAIVVPWAPDLATDYGSDDPNTILQHALFLSPYAYGRDILFTHGPWALWYQRHYWPSTYPVFVLSHVVLALGLMGIVARAALAGFAHDATRLLVVAVAAAVFAIDLDARLFFLLALVPVMDEDEDRALILLSALAGFIGLVKISLLVAALLVVGLKSADEMLRLRRLPRSLIAFAVALPVFYLAAGQDLRHLPDFLRWGIEMSAGYGETMSKSGEAEGLVAFLGAATILFLILAAAFGAVVLTIECSAHGAWGLLPAAALAAVLFAAFKASFVRYDNAHVLHAFATLLPLVAVYAARRREALARRLGTGALRRGLPWALGGGAALVVLAASVLAARDPGLYRNKLDKLMANVEAGADFFATGGARLEMRHEAALARIRADWPMPAVAGSVAIASRLQVVGLAHGFDLRPLPTINLYQAWTPALVDRLAAFFAAPDRPAELFVDLQAIHGSRYWLSVLENYQAVGRAGRGDQFVHMRRRDPPAGAFRRQPVDQIPVAFGQVFELPKEHALWLSATIEPTVFGRVVEILLKKPMVTLRVEYDRGPSMEPPFGPVMAAEGVLVAPRLGAAGFDGLDGPRALKASIRVGPHGDLFYKPDIKVRLDKVLAPP